MYRRGVSVQGDERDKKHAFGNENGYRIFYIKPSKEEIIRRPRRRWKGILN
jgi:hypothetical protein